MDGTLRLPTHCRVKYNEGETTLQCDSSVLLQRIPLRCTLGCDDVLLVCGDGLQVHVEGGLAVVLLPPPRAPGGGVHSRAETERNLYPDNIIIWNTT